VRPVWVCVRPALRVERKGARERAGPGTSVHAPHRRNADSRCPLWRGTCTTWPAEVIVVGWDFAAALLREQAEAPASRRRPVEVAGGRVGDLLRRAAAGVPDFPTAGDVLAHECGHT